MNNVIRSSIVLVSLCALPVLAGTPSGIYVEFYNASAPTNVAPDGWQTVPGFPCRHGPDANNDGIPDNGLGDPEPGLSSGSSVSIFNATGSTYRVFAVSPSSTNIGNVSISTSSSSASPTLFIGRPTSAFQGSGTLSAAGCNNLGSVSFGNGDPVLHGYILGTLTGSISMHRIRWFDFGTASSSGAGTISGNITHNPGAETGVGSCIGIFAKHVDSDSIITVNRSNISTFRVYDDFEGSFRTLNGANATTLDFQGDFDGANVDLDGSLTNLTVIGDATGFIEIDGDATNLRFEGHWGLCRLEAPRISTPLALPSQVTLLARS